MDELIDILDTEGNPTGKTAMKIEAHKNGWFHQTVHIWFYTTNGEILMQLRGKDKDIHPLLWDVSVAGHIGAGEAIEIAAIREIEEEIGIKIKIEQLEKIGVFKSVQKHSSNLIDCEFHHTFMSTLNIPFEKLIKQESEVEGLKLVSINQFRAELIHIKKSNYVPHSPMYYETIYTQIKKKL
ncbi:NUDIX domain-containing protein [Aurantibacter sp.]|uniref:NUDIX hydrolase n=1 Tax=Aurantibacter sp. TaxID=2807103 RepID=UPI0032653965